MLISYVRGYATPMQVLPYIANICLVPSSGFHVDVAVITGFAVDFKAVAFYSHQATKRTMVLSLSLELLEGQGPSCNTQDLNEETLMGGHKAF